jgi:RNA polymerase sigma factor (sigma-70 family)
VGVVTEAPQQEADGVEPSDSDLVLACRRGDAGAWERLVRRFERLVYTVPRRAGLGEEQAADVFQQVFALLVEHLDGLSQPDRVRAWLVTTARRESWRVGRREALIRATTAGASAGSEADGAGAGNEVTLLDLPGDDSPADEALLRLEEQHLVRTALGTLDGRCRTLLALLFYCPEPPPYSEVAATLGLPTGSIGPTRARCLQKLRQRLRQLDPTALEDVSPERKGALSVRAPR